MYAIKEWCLAKEAVFPLELKEILEWLKTDVINGVVFEENGVQGLLLHIWVLIWLINQNYTPLFELT